MKDSICLFIFRRDLRIYDNLALSKLVSSKPNITVLPIFIFNPDQIDVDKNAYYNKNSVEFMVESLQDLNNKLDGKLRYFYGRDIEILDQLYKTYNIDSIAFNKDYTPFAKLRDNKIDEWCKGHEIQLITAEDYTLFPLDKIATNTGNKYEVYTPFYRKCISMYHEIPEPVSKISLKLYSKNVKGTIENIQRFHGNTKNEMRAIKGGRDVALEIIARIKRKEHANYNKDRDYPAKDKTTKLSAYMKFGCLSVREVFWTCVKTYGINHALVRELIWREFCAYITYNNPRLLNKKPLRMKYDKIKWIFNKKWFDAWCNGQTGFPIVDAAMRCLNATGFMHNRLRMIVAMFLTKDMMMYWHYGEKYFAQKLVDYDPSSNVCGWQWSASVGADAQPYFRIFNPWLQSKKFDKDAEFIYKWIPELKNVATKDIHKWDTEYIKYENINYPKPILNHNDQATKIKDVFKRYV